MDRGPVRADADAERRPLRWLAVAALAAFVAVLASTHTFGLTAARAPRAPGTIIGTNGGTGLGAGTASRLISAHIRWDRVNLENGPAPLRQAAREGFKVLAIVGNVPDGTPLSAVQPAAWGAAVAAQLRASPQVAIAEAGNEMYSKGGVSNAVQYGRMYMAAIAAMRAAGGHVPLLFDLRGDYQRPPGTPGAGTWSQDAAGGGWLRDAVAAVPGLAAAILANGVSVHPYGAVGEDVADSHGIAMVPALEAVARQVLGVVPPFYVTEVGFDLGRCGLPEGACSPAEQAAKLRAAYRALLSYPHVAGIWWYESHDDGSGRWGYMNRDRTPRPAFAALAAAAEAQG